MDPSAPSTFGACLFHVGNHHVGALTFLIADLFILSSVGVLTCQQATQVFFSLFTFIPFVKIEEIGS